MLHIFIYRIIIYKLLLIVISMWSQMYPYLVFRNIEIFLSRTALVVAMLEIFPARLMFQTWSRVWDRNHTSGSSSGPSTLKSNFINLVALTVLSYNLKMYSSHSPISFEVLHSNSSIAFQIEFEWMVLNRHSYIEIAIYFFTGGQGKLFQISTNVSVARELTPVPWQH